MTDQPLHDRFELAFTPDRRVDVDALERTVSTRAMHEWMLDRFQDRDERLPVDSDSMETADEVFIDLWRRSGSGSKVRECMGEACAQLVDEAQSAGASPWVRPLLHLVTTIHPAPCEKRLRGAFQQRLFLRGGMKEDGVDRLWLGAFASYEFADLSSIWRELLQNPEYAVSAYHALSTTVEASASYLPDYYRVLPEGERNVLVKQALRRTLRQYGAGCTAEALLGSRGRIAAEDGLSEAINRGLRELGQPPIFTERLQRDHGEAIVDIARERPREAILEAAG